jgi:alpha-N-arabinofuranosidase
MMRIGLELEPFIESQFAMIEAAMPGASVGLIVDEWGVWHQLNGRHPVPGKYLFEQESTMREAVLAALSLNIFNNHCDKVVMANVAQLVNCIDSLFLARGDACVATTSYHVFDMFKIHQHAAGLRTAVDCADLVYTLDGETHSVPAVSCSASVKDGVLAVTLANLAAEDEQPVTFRLHGGCFAGAGTMTVLASSSHKNGNSFEEPFKVVPKEQPVSASGQELTVTMPKAAVVLLRLDISPEQSGAAG